MIKVFNKGNNLIKKCIFCNENSENSKSVEHIIPESLGNNKYILEPGIVSDKCNNYFSRAIEKPILDSEDFRNARFYQYIESKKGKIPNTEALIAGNKVLLHWGIVGGVPSLMMGVSPEDMINILNKKPKTFFTKGIDVNIPNLKYEMSRFIAKVGYEMYIYLSLEHAKERYKDYKIYFDIDESFDKIRKFIRYGRNNKKPWKYSSKKIKEYEPGKMI